jgi:hypothetical protein
MDPQSLDRLFFTELTAFYLPVLTVRIADTRLLATQKYPSARPVC